MKNIMMNSKLIVSVLSLFTFSAANAELPDVQEGLWEITSTASIVGMPSEIPPLVQKQCFTPKSISPENLLKQNNCKMDNMDMQSNHVSWSMNCEQQGMVMQGSGNIQYQKTSFSGTFDLTMSGAPEGAMGMNTTIKGRYIGRCP